MRDEVEYCRFCGCTLSPTRAEWGTCWECAQEEKP